MWMARLIKLTPYLAGALLVCGIWLHGDHHGARSTELEYKQAALDMQESMRIVANELEKAQREREVVVKEVIRNVYIEKDPTGCADAPMLNSVYSELRSSTD